jgi:hypothetical protein
LAREIGQLEKQDASLTRPGLCGGEDWRRGGATEKCPHAAIETRCGGLAGTQTTGYPLNRSGTMLADPTIGDRIARKADGGRRPEFIWEISVYLIGKSMGDAMAGLLKWTPTPRSLKGHMGLDQPYRTNP